jgi:hypothetical protein
MAEDFVIPSGGVINTISYDNQECEDGVTIDFGDILDLPPAEEYFIKISTESQAPLTPPYQVSISPDQYSLSSRSFIPITVVNIDSVHEGETNTLFKLQIYDRYNQLLKTKYVKLKCVSTVTYSTTFDFSNTNFNGPNGGTYITLKNVEVINIGSTVSGSDYFEDGSRVVSIFGSNQVEIFPPIKNNNIGGVISLQDKPITINLRTGCDSAESLLRRSSTDNYIYLSEKNNWTYSYQGKTLLKFVNNTNDNSIIVRVPAQNQTLLPNDTEKTNIPNASSFYIGGRIYRLGPCNEDL